MKAVFLDTGYVLALELSNDQNHRAVLKHCSMLKTLPPLVTTSYVFAVLPKLRRWAANSARSLRRMAERDRQREEEIRWC